MITILDVSPFLSRRRIIVKVEGLGYYEARYPDVTSFADSIRSPIRKVAYRLRIDKEAEGFLCAWLQRAVGTVHDFGTHNLKMLGLPVTSEWCSCICSNFPILGLKEACNLVVVPNIWLWTPDQFAEHPELFEKV